METSIIQKSEMFDISWEYKNGHRQKVVRCFSNKLRKSQNLGPRSSADLNEVIDGLDILDLIQEVKDKYNLDWTERAEVKPAPDV